MSDHELLHATDSRGRHVKTAPRGELLREIREHAWRHGDAPLAVPVVHIILMDGTGQLRLVQRGEKPENPLLWDKAVGGHVVWPDPTLPAAAFEENARREMAEELGIDRVEVARDPFDYAARLGRGDLDLAHTALIRLIDYDPWQASQSRVRQGPAWVKRHNVATYAGCYDGIFTFVDGEALAETRMTPAQLDQELFDKPWLYADGAGIFMARYRHLLRV